MTMTIDEIAKYFKVTKISTPMKHQLFGNLIALVTFDDGSTMSVIRKNGLYIWHCRRRKTWTEREQAMFDVLMNAGNYSK